MAPKNGTDSRGTQGSHTEIQCEKDLASFQLIVNILTSLYLRPSKLRFVHPLSQIPHFPSARGGPLSQTARLGMKSGFPFSSFESPFLS